MKKNNIECAENLFQDEICRMLARAYQYILSWPDHKKYKTAGSENFGEDTEPAVEDTPIEEDVVHES